MDCKNCHKCLEGKLNEFDMPITWTRMIVCSICGNKRCPKATNHEFECTNSNEPGQIGFVYE